MYQREIKHQSLSIEGILYTAENLPDPALQTDPFRKELFTFLHDWFSPTETLSLQTSGSTGTPKCFQASKSQLIASAIQTCRFLELHEHEKALLCLPLTYIAGKMMVVRALVAKLDLYPVAPSSHPLANIAQRFRFAAMIPLQVSNSLTLPLEKERLEAISQLIIGGAAIDPLLERNLQPFSNAIYATYGMTETLSHIALRRVSGDTASNRYTPLPSVSLSLSTEETLIVDAPQLCQTPLTTTDRATLFPDGSFILLGRADNVINSGGIKIQPETIEQLLATQLTTPFVVTSVPDKKLGERVVLLTTESLSMASIESILSSQLPKYWIPKEVLTVCSIPLTPNGKIDRRKSNEIALQKTVADKNML